MLVKQAEAISADLVRAVRGRRTQTAFSRALGYQSNVAHRWETRESFPTAVDFLNACAKVRPSSKQLFVRFFNRRPDWLDAQAPFSASSVALFLRDLRGKTPIGVLATRSGYNRYKVGRWLAGKTQPRLPEFFALVEAASRRLLDLIACLTSPLDLPSVADAWRELEAARTVAYSVPWSHAVLRALELEGYRGLRGRAAMQWLARSLGLSENDVRKNLAALADAGQIERRGGRWVSRRVLDVDTGRDPERARALKHAWSEVAVGRLKNAAPGLYGYSVFAIARCDLARLRELQLEYARAMQSIIASSQPSECVGLYCVQLLDLSALHGTHDAQEASVLR